MKTFYQEPDSQVFQYNQKIKSNLSEYYLLEKIETIEKIKSVNLKTTYLNEKYHIKIYYISRNNKIYSRIYPREDFCNKFTSVKIENRKSYSLSQSMKFFVKTSQFRLMKENDLLKSIINSGYTSCIKTKLDIDLTDKKKRYKLIENPVVYPEEMCNIKYNIVSQEYFNQVFEYEQRNLNLVKNMTGILPTMKVHTSTKD